MFNGVFQAALYILVTITSVSALAVALFGPAAALERWLDDPVQPRPGLTSPRSLRNSNAPLHHPGAHSQSA